MNMNKALQNLYHAVSGSTTTKVNISKLLVDIHYAITGKESENKNNWSKIINSMADNWPEGGGGGSSDFSTATVTATYTLPEEVTSLEGLSFSSGFIKTLNADYYIIIQIEYGQESLPVSDLGNVENINVPIYKDYPTNISDLIYNIPEEGYFWVDLANSSVVSGDAVIDIENYCLLVSGNCSLNIELCSVD